MAKKNPFVNCKSRKRRKTTVRVKQEPKGYCPKTMIRYDNAPNIPLLWVCKICLKGILNEDTVRQHILTCKIYEMVYVPQRSILNNPIEEIEVYKCKHCNKVFKRQVALKTHEVSCQRHEYSLISENSDSDVEILN